MGTPEFAVPSLDILVRNGYHVVGVITSPDRKSGRGQKITTSAVKDYAVAHGIKVLQPDKFKNEEFLDELKALNADLQVVVAFRMLPEVVWSMPSLGTINLHGSLLPDYRGAAPINWCIINGDEFTGVTTFFIEKEIDTGNIIQQTKIAIGKNETAGELHDRMMDIGAQTLLDTVDLIKKGEAIGIDQEEFKTSLRRKAPKIFKADCEIDWNQSVNVVHNFVRGLSPYPAAWTKFDDKIFKILKGIPSEEASSNIPHKIKTDNKTFLHISTKTHDYSIRELQMQGKKRMKLADFLRGYHFTKVE